MKEQNKTKKEFGGDKQLSSRGVQGNNCKEFRRMIDEQSKKSEVYNKELKIYRGTKQVKNIIIGIKNIKKH